MPVITILHRQSTILTLYLVVTFTTLELVVTPLYRQSTTLLLDMTSLYTIQQLYPS